MSVSQHLPNGMDHSGPSRLGFQSGHGICFHLIGAARLLLSLGRPMRTTHAQRPKFP